MNFPAHHAMAVIGWETLRGAGRQHKRWGDSYLFGAWIYALKHQDLEAAGFLYTKLKEVEAIVKKERGY